MIEKNYQPVLFPYAYNILGSAEDAKDAIQDVLLKYTLSGIQPENEKNYLIKGVINQSINIKRRNRRIQPAGVWLPEPVNTEKSNPEPAIESKELLSYSLLFLLESLSPKERAVFILKEAFSYTHEEIAEVLAISSENSRKLFSRASKKIGQKESSNVRTESFNDNFNCINQLVSAIQNQDLEKIHKLLAEDISFYADGGKGIKVVKNYCSGIKEVADLLVYVYNSFEKEYTVLPAVINHQPAMLFFHNHVLKTCKIFEVSDNCIKSISVVLAPEKLKYLVK